MKRNILACFCVIFLIGSLFSCSDKTEANLQDSVTESAVDSLEVEDGLNLVSDGGNFKIMSDGQKDYCYLYDNSGKAVCSHELPHGVSPDIQRIDDDLIRFTVQTGTGIATQYGFYFDPESGVMSADFQSIYGEFDGKVICRKAYDIVVVQDIFDASVYYKEISDWKYDFAPSADPIIDVKAVNGGIEVTYQSGENYTEVTERFLLKKSIFYDTDGIDADKRLEDILDALKKQNKDNIKSMFSEKALAEDVDFDEHLDYLFEFFQGDVLSRERKGGPFVSEHINYGSCIKKESSAWYRVETDKQSYLFIFIEYPIDKEEPDNVGLYTLCVIPAKNQEAENQEPEFKWDDVTIPGIYIPE